MDESRAINSDSGQELWGGESRPIAKPMPPQSVEVHDGSTLQQLVERQPGFVMAATLLFAVGTICLVMGAFLLG